MTQHPLRAPADLPDPLLASLAMISSRAPGPCEDWLIIGSTAARLCGADLEPDDIDVIASSYTIRAFLEAFGLQENNRIGHDIFRSRIFQRFEPGNATPIEFMGDMILIRENPRVPMPIQTRVEIVGTYGSVFVPDLKEQIAILRRFGRAKDLARIPKLEAALAAKGS